VSVPVDYTLNAFIMRTGQPDFGCPIDAYTLEVEDPSVTGTYYDSTALSWLTLDSNTPKMTIDLADPTFATTVTYRLTYNTYDPQTFVVTSCYMIRPASFLTDPTQSFTLLVTDISANYVFEAYAYVDEAACGLVAYNMVGMESWMVFNDPSPTLADPNPSPSLLASVFASAVTTKVTFSMVFEVLDSGGNIVISESFTLTVLDCRDADGASLSFGSFGAVMYVTSG
jgi:hypothetical protein